MQADFYFISILIQGLIALNPSKSVKNIMNFVSLWRSIGQGFMCSVSEMYQASLIDLIITTIPFAFHKADPFIEMNAAT